MTSVALNPADLILQTYNAYDKKIASAPNQILNYLNNYLNCRLNENQINLQTCSQQFDSNYSAQRSFEEVQTDFAVSIGISGSFGFYSGSIQTNYGSKKSDSTTTFNSGFNAVVSCGTCSFYQPDSMVEIAKCLQPDLLEALKNISNFQQAKEFTSTYGTHLILGVSLGGSLYVGVSATTSSLSTQTELDIKVEAAYKGVGSMSATASVTSKLASKYENDGFSYTVRTIGGNSAAAAKMQVDKSDTYADWAVTCTAETVCGVSNSLELWQLAKGIAKEQLQLYVQLVALQQSIQYPSYFSNNIAPQPFRENKAQATVGVGFKIIGGGAAVNRDSGNFLTGSYPNLDQNGNIAGWNAASRDLVSPSNPATDVLSAYAVGIYDPNNLLSIKIGTSSGTNPNVGGDSATAVIPDNYVLIGGGAHGDLRSGGVKFLMQSFPDSSVKNGWTGMIHDYKTPANNVPLTVYAIGVHSEYFTISPQITTQSAERVQHGNAVAEAQIDVAGGGVQVTSLDGGGNLVQQTYPSSPTTWTEYNKDTDGYVSPANSVAYAIHLITSELS